MSAEKKKRGPKPEVLNIELDDDEEWEDVVKALAKRSKEEE